MDPLAARRLSATSVANTLSEFLTRAPPYARLSRARRICFESGPETFGIDY
jgi:hypothetical protein